jgi:hypothetical protein
VSSRWGDLRAPAARSSAKVAGINGGAISGSRRGDRRQQRADPIALRTQVLGRLDDDRAWKPDEGGGHNQGGGDFEEAGQFNNVPIAPRTGASLPNS